MRTLSIPRRLLDDILTHAREGAPNEVCGLMAGKGDSVERIYRSSNVNATPVSYHLDPGEQLRAMREIEREGLELAGIYHSHPVSLAYPSLTDIARAFFPGTKDENFPGAVYVIVSLAGGSVEVKGFEIDADGVREVRIDVV